MGTQQGSKPLFCSGSEDSTTKVCSLRRSLLSQRHWRTIGLVALATCGVMAWLGTRPGFSEYGRNTVLVFWAIFLLSLLVTLYMVLLDFRYIRMEYKIRERALFEETLGNESFRREMLQAQKEINTSEGDQGS